MGKGEKRPSWFKMFLHQKSIVDSVSDEVVGKAVKAAYHYFATREELPLDVLPMVVYASFKPYIEESFADYERDVRNGHRGGRPQKTPVTPGKGGLPTLTQAEAEAETEAETEKEACNKAGKPPAPTKKSFSQYGWVKLSQAEYDRLVADLGETEAKRCIAYVDESAQSTNNKNRWRDWNLVVRKCSRDGWGKQKSANHQMPDYGGAGNWSL